MPLFDGRTLKGWKKVDGTANVVVRDGTIVGIATPGAANTFIATEDESFEDFIFECEFRCDEGNNSGVQFRSRFADDKIKRGYGYQYEIDPTPRALTGGLYEEGGKPRRGWLAPDKNSGAPRDVWNKTHGDHFKPGGWNTMRIEARGTHIRTWLNGHLLTDFVDTSEMAIPRGFIGMQIHPQTDPKLFGKEVAFRNLRVQKLNPSTLPAADQLAGHWPLIADARDVSDAENHGTAHSVRFTREGAIFDGRKSRIEIPSAASLDFGSGNFTLALWVNTEKELSDTLGDLLSKYDPERRTGVNLSITHNAGTGSQANYRNLQFGIDNAQQDAEWTDRGRPGKALFIHSLAVHQGDLYAGTVEGRTNNDHGHVYRYDGRDKWEDLGAPWKSNGVTAMASYDGHLYVGVSRVLLHYSGLEPTLAHHIGGKVFRYDDGKWVDLGQLLGVDGVNGMAVFRGKLYVTGFYQPGLFRYEGGIQWTALGSPGGMRPEGLIVRDGALYASGYDEGAVYRFDGENWTHTGRLGNSTQVYGQGIYQGQHLAGTWEFGTVYRHEEDGNWVSTGRLGAAEEVMGLSVYNGKVYAGTLPMAEIFRYDGDNRWKSTGRVDFTPDVLYRRAWSMAVFDGKLFVGTLPSGHVRSFEAGKTATYDHELAPGWRHIAAVRDGNCLNLYIDGKLVSRSTEFNPGNFNLSNATPLHIGFGQHDYFNGTAKDVRIYKQALTAPEIAGLARPR